MSAESSRRVQAPGSDRSRGRIAARSAVCLVTAIALAGPAGAEFTGFSIDPLPVGDLRDDGVSWVRYRVHADFDDPDDRLQVVYGDSTSSLVLASSGGEGFYQDVSPTSGPIEHWAANEVHFPTLAHDSYFTIGCTDSAACGFTDTCPGLAFGTGAIHSDNTCWMRLLTPDNEEVTRAGVEGRVLLGQFTIEAGATLNGTVNLVTRENGEQTVHSGLEFSASYEPPCVADTNGDGVVNVNDLNNVILDWGSDGTAHGGDVTSSVPGGFPDGVVNVNDLNAIIIGWGGCD